MGAKYTLRMVKLVTNVLNTSNAAAMVSFWTAFLQAEVCAAKNGFTRLKAAEDPPRMGSQEVPDPTPGPRRLPSDFAADGVDRDVARAVEAGAAHVEERMFPDFRWVVPADPDGQEFCIAPNH